MAKTIKTIWEVRTYDVWGNSHDGYVVNDSFVVNREYPLTLTVNTYNAGTSDQFDGASPTDSQIREVFGCARIGLDIDGDDLTIYVNRARDGYPIGEMYCVSHNSLSPIRQREEID